MFSLIKTPYCYTNPPVTIYAILSNFQISWFTRFFAPPQTAPLIFLFAPPRGFSSSPCPARKSFAPHIPATNHKTKDVPRNKNCVITSLASLLPLSETLFETGLSQPARFSSKGNKSVQKLKGLVFIDLTLNCIYCLVYYWHISSTLSYQNNRFVTLA